MIHNPTTYVMPWLALWHDPPPITGQANQFANDRPPPGIVGFHQYCDLLTHRSRFHSSRLFSIDKRAHPWIAQNHILFALMRKPETRAAARLSEIEM